MRHVYEERKRQRRLRAESGAEGARETEETGSRSEGASQLAHTSPLERPREGKRGPGTGNLLLYTRPEIRMYHSRTHVGARARARARAHGRPVVGLIHMGPGRENDDGKLVRTTKVDLRSTGHAATHTFLIVPLRAGIERFRRSVCARARKVPAGGL